MNVHVYTGPWAYSEYDKSIPASVRLRNIGAIGSSRDNHEARFGALDPHTLPASDGSDLPTPAFSSIYGGAAYWGHFVIRRAQLVNKPAGVTSIASIMKAYSTGHAEAYSRSVSKDSGVGLHEPIDLWSDPQGYHKLYRVMIAMGRWEAGARSESAPGYEAFNVVYNLFDQAVVDELYWGMVHGCREAWRDQGYTIEVTPEEMTYVVSSDAATSAPEPLKKKQQTNDEAKDPLIDGVSGWRTVITGTLGIMATFFTAVFDLLGLENAEKLGGVTAQVLIGLAALFLILKFWKRVERILKRSIRTL